MVRRCVLIGVGVTLLTVCITPSAAQQLNWVQKLPGNSPSPRFGHAMAYDAARGQVVLFGGADSHCTFFCNDTWVWDGTNWTQKNPVNNPPPRWFHRMAYDAVRGQVVLFGGSNTNNVLYSDTWVWDGTNWTQKSPAISPPPRDFFGMAYDAARGQVVVFGGTNFNVSLNDTWVWNGTNWTQKSPANSPPQLSFFSMAYDAARGQVVLFGGNNVSGYTTQDTWVWDGTTWAKKVVTSKPNSRSGHEMAYDAARGQVILFGGRDDNNVQFNETWAWDGANWTQKSPANSPPRGGGGGNLTYDAARAQVVLFGGIDSGGNVVKDTWVWGLPSQPAPAPPPPTAVIDAITGVSPNVAITLRGSNSHVNAPGSVLVEYRWDIQQSSGTDTLFGSQISYLWNTPGTYLATLTVKDTNGNIGATNAVVTIPRPQQSCWVDPITPLATLIQQYPDSYPGATFGMESNDLDTVHLQANMQSALACFQTGIQGAGGTFVLTSGYRTDAYQVHLRDVWDKWNALRPLAGDPTCAQIYVSVQVEFTKHGMVHAPAGPSGPHTTGSAIDACADGIAQSACGGSIPHQVLTMGQTLNIADACGLYRRLPTDPVHFEHK